MNQFLRRAVSAACLTMIVSAPVGASGGPDAFGYTWIQSTDVGGPTQEWIDISVLGTVVTGLADDNAAPTLIQLPQPFRYYWRDYSTLKVGSNGWVSFENISNIAACFPSIPTAGGSGDSILAPLMGDLNFTGAGNAGVVRTYFDATNNLFIVSYTNTPFWSVNSPGWTGNNSFQIVLDYDDRSIRYNYQGLSGFTNGAGCLDLVVGIESPTGQYGLQVVSDALPTQNNTIRFDYPAVPGISIVDVEPQQVLSPNNQATIADIALPFTFATTVGNSGNATTASPVDVLGEIVVPGPGGATAYSQAIQIASLAADQQQVVTFAPTYTVASGKQAARVTVGGGGDINAGNNVRLVELFGVDAQAVSQQVSYVAGETGNGSINWNGGNTPDQFGVASEFVLPEAANLISSVGAQMSSSTGNGYALELRNNDGANGVPGTLLARIDVPGASVVSGQWQDFNLATPVLADADGLYLVWYQQSTTTFLATNNSGVPSRRNLELLAGAYSAFRFNEIQDPFLRVTASSSRRFSNGFE